MAYAMAGPYLPPPWTHRGYGIDQLVGHLFITLEGIFGIPVDVSSSLIILFTIYGAFLQHSGAGKFFIDFSLRLMGNKPNAAGRTVVLSSFLLGGPSGSGVATTVTVGAVAYPMMQKAGFEKNAAGGLLAAGGLGAIISPPVLGAAAFLIAEFLKISYLDVIWMAVIPTCLYYLSLLFMVELDGRRFGGGAGVTVEDFSWWQSFHFISLIAIIVFMLIGRSPALSVFYATVLAFALSFLTRETALTPKRLVRALSDGSTSVLTAATTCATAGIIVGVVTLTGLGQKFADIVISYAGGSLLLTAIYTALVVWIVGLAVPVTASYIICAVIAAPAMIKLDVPPIAAHMFIFYYSVLSEVSPPTALSPFAAAAITGGDPYKTTLQAWKYTLPAFLVPFVFVLDPQGIGLLLQIPKNGSAIDIVLITLKTGLGLAALASAAQGWAHPQDHARRAPAAAAGGPADGVPGLARGLRGGHHRPRHQLHRDIWHADRRGGADKTMGAAGTAGRTSDRPTLGRINDHGQSEQDFRSLRLRWRPLAFAGAAVAQNMNIAIATGGTGGVYYPLGGGMANVLSKYVPGVQATARVTGGSVDNLRLIHTGQSEVALVMVDAALDALKGEDKFKGSPVAVRTLMVLYPNRMHVVSIEGTGVTSMASLKGKRVSTGSPGSATEVMAFRVIEAAGLDRDKDMRRERLGVAESVNALKDRRIDAFFWVGGLPTAAVTDLGATPGVKIAMIDHADVVEKMNAKYGGIYSQRRHSGQDLSRTDEGQRDRGGAEHPGRQREDAGPGRLRHRQDLHRAAEGADRGACRGGEHRAGKSAPQEHAPSRGIRARSATSTSAA